MVLRRCQLLLLFPLSPEAEEAKAAEAGHEQWQSAWERSDNRCTVSTDSANRKVRELESILSAAENHRQEWSVRRKDHCVVTNRGYGEGRTGETAQICSGAVGAVKERKRVETVGRTPQNRN